MEFFWTSPQSLEHAVTFAPWNNGLLVPSALSPSAFAYTIGASGLVDQQIATVSGMSGGFAGSVSDGAGGAWLVGYHGDVTYLGSSGNSTAYGIPSSASGDIFVGVVMNGSSPYFVATNGDIFTIAGNSLVTVTPGFGELVSSITADQLKLYAVLPDSQNLAEYTLTTSTTGSIVKIPIPMETPAFAMASPSAIAVGGSSDSALPVGAAAFAASQFSTTAAAAVNTAANRIYLFTGTEPDWSLNSVVSGVGHPVGLTWTSLGEQVMVADTVSGTASIFNIVAGVLVQFQNVAVSGVANVASTQDGLTVMAAQPSLNQVSVLTNTANLWAVTSTVSITGALCALDLSNTEFVVGGTTSISWVQSSNNGWIVGSSVSGMAFTPSDLTTDGAGTIYAVGTSGGKGFLAAVNQNGVVTSANWTGSGDAVLFQQAQIVVSDSASSLLRVFANVGDSIIQQATVAGPTGLKGLGATSPSIWACGASGISQFALTAPFELDHQRQGIFAIYENSAWVSGTTGVLNAPTAAAWDVSGTVWAATEQDMLNRYSMDAVAVSGISLAPYLATNAVPIGISSMAWFNGALFAVSSLNSSLIGVSGQAVVGVPGVVPGTLLGINFILGESFYQ